VEAKVYTAIREADKTGSECLGGKGLIHHKALFHGCLFTSSP